MIKQSKKTESIPLTNIPSCSFLQLPSTAASEKIDIAIVGIPFSASTSGAQSAPGAIRMASGGVRPINPRERNNAVKHCNIVDCGDISVVPGMIDETYAATVRGLKPLLDAGAVPICMGGDHSVTLGEIRAVSARHGKLSFVLLDAHHDVYDSYNEGRSRYNAATHLRRAVEEGLVDPGRSVIVGLRTFRDVDDDAEDMGIKVIPIDEVVEQPVSATIDAIHKRIGKKPAFLSFDIDVIDPAFAPGTGSQVPGGLTSREAFSLLRGLDGNAFVGFDLVEVNPQLDDSPTTTRLAAHIIFEIITLVAFKDKKR